MIKFPVHVQFLVPTVNTQKVNSTTNENVRHQPDNNTTCIIPRSCLAPSDTVMMNGTPQQVTCNTGTSNFATIGHLEKAITKRQTATAIVHRMELSVPKTENAAWAVHSQQGTVPFSPQGFVVLNVLYKRKDTQLKSCNLSAHGSKKPARPCVC